MAQKTQHSIDLSRRLFIELGTALLIETGKTGKVLSSKLVGMKVGDYLIVDISGTKSHPDGLHQEEKVRVRYVNQDDIFHFASRVLLSLDQPDRLVFLHYPDKVESCNVRSHKRIDCFMQIMVKAGDRQDSAVITNISVKGCLCTMDRFQAGETIGSQKVDLSFPYGDKESLTIAGEVKSTQIQGTQIKLGIQFDEMDAYSKSVLTTLVPAIRF